MTSGTSCHQCNAALQPGMRFCPGCGAATGPEGTHLTVGLVTGPFQIPPDHLEVLRKATLGEYEILGELGRGGMATVYLAHDFALDRKVAIKLMSPDLAQAPGLAERFKREARTAGVLSHPHIIPIYAVREEPTALYFVMKYVPGRTLESILQEDGPLPFPMVRCILTEVGNALDYAHRHGVIHRDVKPGNIMLDDEGYAVVTDFGIAKALQSPGLTQTGSMVGTPCFLSPEACLGGAITPAADQYALGIVAYQMITGQLPFIAESSMALMYAQVNTPPTPLATLREACPPEAQAAVLRMLAKAPEARWPSIKDAVAALAAALPPVDDAVRTEISALARRRPPHQVAENYTTPTSPIPGPRLSISPPPLSPTAPRTPLTIAVSPRPSGGRMATLSLLAVALALGGTWLATHRQPAPADSAAASVAPERMDSLLLAAQGAARFARARAVEAGATAKALAAGDALSARADSIALRNRRSEARQLLEQATASWTKAEEAARPVPARPGASIPAPAGAVAPQPVAAAPPSEPAAPPPVERSDSEQIAAYYGELQQALNARQLGEVKRLLPNLRSGDEKNWRSLFESKDVQAIEVGFVILKVTRQGEAAEAELYYDQRITKKGKMGHSSRNQVATLTLGPQGWRQIQVREVR